MKHINLHFEDSEFEALSKIKKKMKGKTSWHDAILAWAGAKK